jgi:hypothetical protein
MQLSQKAASRRGFLSIGDPRDRDLFARLVAERYRKLGGFDILAWNAVRHSSKASDLGAAIEREAKA